MADETLRRSGALSAAVAASRVLGLARESLFAAAFGAGAVADAFQVAFRIPNLLRDLLAEGALSSAFVPTFMRARKEGGDAAAFQLGNEVLAALSVVTGLLTALGIVWAQPIVLAMTGGFQGDAAKLALTVALTQLMMPVLSLVSIGALWMGMANAAQRYVVAALAPAAFNAVSIAVGVVLLVVDTATERAIEWWCIGTLLAALVQAAMQLPTLWRLGYRPWLPLLRCWSSPGVRHVAHLMAPAVLGVAAVQVNVFFNTQFASALGDGPVAQLSYAFRVFFLPLGVFSVAIATVTTTRVSQDLADNNPSRVISTLNEGAMAVWMLMLASTIGLVVLAEPVIRLLFERGAFGPLDTIATARVLQAYAIGLVPYGLVKVYAPAFYGMDRARLPLIASMVAIAVNIGFSAYTHLTLGAMGLALGTSLGALVNVAVLRIALGRALDSPALQSTTAASPLKDDSSALVEPSTILGLSAGGRRHIVSLVLASMALCTLLLAVWLPLRPLIQGGARGQLWLALCMTLLIPAAGTIFLAVLVKRGYPGASAIESLAKRLVGRARRGRAGVKSVE